MHIVELQGVDSNVFEYVVKVQRTEELRSG